MRVAQFVQRRDGLLYRAAGVLHERQAPCRAVAKRQNAFAGARLRDGEDVRHLAVALLLVAHRIVGQLVAEADLVDIFAADGIIRADDHVRDMLVRRIDLRHVALRLAVARRPDGAAVDFQRAVAAFRAVEERAVEVRILPQGAVLPVHDVRDVEGAVRRALLQRVEACVRVDFRADEIACVRLHDAARAAPPCAVVALRHAARPDVEVVAVGVRAMVLQADADAHHLDVAEAVVAHAAAVVDADARHGPVVGREDGHVLGENRPRAAAFDEQAVAAHVEDADMVDERRRGLRALRDADAAFMAVASYVQLADVHLVVAREVQDADGMVFVDDGGDKPCPRLRDRRDARISVADDRILQKQRLLDFVNASGEIQ